MIGDRHRTGKKVNAATMTTTPVKLRPNVQPCVGSVPEEASTVSVNATESVNPLAVVVSFSVTVWP